MYLIFLFIFIIMSIAFVGWLSGSVTSSDYYFYAYSCAAFYIVIALLYKDYKLSFFCFIFAIIYNIFGRLKTN